MIFFFMIFLFIKISSNKKHNIFYFLFIITLFIILFLRETYLLVININNELVKQNFFVLRKEYFL